MKTIRVVAAVIKAVNEKGEDIIFATQRGYGEFKGGWEFPGGKIEDGETPKEALKREIREELDIEIAVGEMLDTIEYDYPTFHLSMDCFWCEIVSGNLVLKEHEDARWLTKEELDEVEWLPADITLIDNIIKEKIVVMSNKDLSKYISLILRHKPETIGISLDEHGWANVEELIAGIAKNNEFNMDILEEIVRTDEKQRYSFNEDKTLIRANQGHSIAVDVELEEQVPPKILWHGTGEKYVSSIDNEGLIPKSRLYVHLSKDEETAVKVGSRHGKPVIYHVLAKQMYDDGYKFYLSVNGVWLTKEVPVKYLKKI